MPVSSLYVIWGVAYADLDLSACDESKDPNLIYARSENPSLSWCLIKNNYLGLLMPVKDIVVQFSFQFEEWLADVRI